MPALRKALHLHRRKKRNLHSLLCKAFLQLSLLVPCGVPPVCNRFLTAPKGPHTHLNRKLEVRIKDHSFLEVIKLAIRISQLGREDKQAIGGTTMKRYTLGFLAITLFFTGVSTGAFVMASRQSELFERIELIGKGLPFAVLALFSLGASVVSWVKE